MLEFTRVHNPCTNSFCGIRCFIIYQEYKTLRSSTLEDNMLFEEFCCLKFLFMYKTFLFNWVHQLRTDSDSSSKR